MLVLIFVPKGGLYLMGSKLGLSQRTTIRSIWVIRRLKGTAAHDALRTIAASLTSSSVRVFTDELLPFFPLDYLLVRCFTPSGPILSRTLQEVPSWFIS
jgi:hypothetical protein